MTYCGIKSEECIGVENEACFSRKHELSVEKENNINDLWIKDKNILQMIGGKLDFGFYVFDYSVNKYIYVNNAMENIFGVSFQEINGRKESLLDAIHEEDKEIIKKQWTLKYVNTMEFRTVNSSNETRWYRCQRQTGDCSGKAPGKVIGVVFDITDVKKNELRVKINRYQIQNADRISHLGRLVGDIVHDINNLNNLTTLCAPVLRRAWERIPSLNESADQQMANMELNEFNRKMEKLIDSISNESAKIHKVVKELRTYIKMDDLSVSKPIDLNEIIGSAISLMEPMIRKATANFAFIPGPENLIVKVHYMRLEQVFINLIHNACDAMKNRNDKIQIRSKLTADNTIEISVEDSGCGMTQEVMEKAGTPFFTTKGNGRLGLGLHLSKEIISEHGGTLLMESCADSGTVVKLLFCRECGV